MIDPAYKPTGYLSISLLFQFNTLGESSVNSTKPFSEYLLLKSIFLDKNGPVIIIKKTCLSKKKIIYISAH